MRVHDAMGNSTRNTKIIENAKIHPSDEHAIPAVFFVLGPPRTGTSWLHEVLKRHTNLPAPTKETRFFDLHFQRGAKWYRAHFPNLRPDRLSGEIAPTYFASTDARRRIAETVPTAKLIFIFRNPVQRVVSLYRVKRAFGMLAHSFEEALERDPELIESGRYATNLREWQLKFPSKQLLVTVYDDLQRDPQAFIDSVSDFLEIPQVQLLPSQLKSVHSSDRLTEPRYYLATRSATVLADWCKARRLDNVVATVRRSPLMKLFLGGGAPFPEIQRHTLQRLEEIFRPEVEMLEEMVGRSFPEWKSRSETESDPKTPVDTML
jgi:hypothetical protein